MKKIVFTLIIAMALMPMLATAGLFPEIGNSAIGFAAGVRPTAVIVTESLSKGQNNIIYANMYDSDGGMKNANTLISIKSPYSSANPPNKVRSLPMTCVGDEYFAECTYSVTVDSTWSSDAKISVIGYDGSLGAYTNKNVKVITSVNNVNPVIPEETIKKLPPCGNYGDVDYDGYVTATDAAVVSQNVGNSAWPEDQKNRADADGNGEVSFYDSITINDYATGKLNTFPVCTATARSPPCGIYGDVDNDGYVSTVDATIVSQNVGNSAWPEDKKKRADVDGNGDVSFSDSIAINDYATFKIDTFPICTASSCKDSDNGVTPYVYGITSNPDTSEKDWCPVSGGTYMTLIEYYCSGSDIKEASWICPYGCADGACLGYNGQQLTCTDSDNGKDYSKAGTVTAGTFSKSDFCGLEDKNYVMEWYCGENNEFMWDYYKCENGCADGACITSSTACTDSDGGKDYFVKGTTVGLAANDVMTTRVDNCWPNNYFKDGYDYVAEWFCWTNTGTGKTYAINTNEKCLNGCKDGACLPPSQPTCKDMTCEQANQISGSKAKIYDINSNNIIDLQESLTAIVDWSRGLMSKDEVCGIVNLWSKTCQIAEFSCKDGQLIGDLNNDNMLTSDDSEILKKVIAGQIKTPDNICCIDINSDGAINVLDLTKLNLIISGQAQVPGRCSMTDECAQEGESIPVYPGAMKCCEGLTPISIADVDGDTCGVNIGAQVCTKCGDGICGIGENKCNCAKDCGSVQNTCEKFGGYCAALYKCASGEKCIGQTCREGYEITNNYACDNGAACCIPKIMPVCTDTDGGINEFVKGTVTATNEQEQIGVIVPIVVSDETEGSVPPSTVRSTDSCFTYLDSAVIKKSGGKSFKIGEKKYWVTVSKADIATGEVSLNINYVRYETKKFTPISVDGITFFVNDVRKSEPSTQQEIEIFVNPTASEKGDNLVEYYCKEDGGIGYKIFTCKEGCVDGACLNLGTCKYGETKCVGEDLYKCAYTSGKLGWKISEDNALKCSATCRTQDSECSLSQDPCCEGLKAVSMSKETVDGTCVDAKCGTVCLPCGNGVCDEGENICNCKQDCKYSANICENSGGYCVTSGKACAKSFVKSEQACGSKSQTCCMPSDATPSCDGCSFNGKCISVGSRATDKGAKKYCSFAGSMDVQKAGSDTCENSFECKSNVCADNTCISGDLLTKILNWIRNLGGK